MDARFSCLILGFCQPSCYYSKAPTDKDLRLSDINRDVKLTSKFQISSFQESEYTRPQVPTRDFADQNVHNDFFKRHWPYAISATSTQSFNSCPSSPNPETTFTLPSYYPLHKQASCFPVIPQPSPPLCKTAPTMEP